MSQAKNDNTHIGIVIIMYNPKNEDIQHIQSLSEHYNGCIVDNSDTPFTKLSSIGNMHYICNHANLGIAEAQNIGVRYLIENYDIHYFVFIDQDSRIESDYPQRIVNAFKEISIHKKLAMLGPKLIHKDNRQEYHSVIHKDKVSDDGMFIPRRDVISSGSCISRQAFNEIGLYDSRLFIDDVDYEWGWRAQAHGYVCGISPKVSIFHKVGQKELRIGKYIIIISASFRYYYQYRNYFWLLRKKYVPLQWKINMGIKYSLRFIYFPVIVEKGFERWKYMCRGIKDGIKG